ncbi:MAG: hypothetical protein KDD94_11000, partial [Calditrichaeota bacterium]|nr:hypothetical protein [Calditrichota bacterium]
IDLSSLASKKGIIQIGIQALVARYINRYISKRQQRSNWENDVLSKQQQVYAATDAWICLKLYPELIADETDYRQFKEE